MSEWTPERTGPLVALWNEGKSGSQIANYLGTTRNAVIGKLHRMGLTGIKRVDQATWNERQVHRAPPSPPRSFSWERVA